MQITKRGGQIAYEEYASEHCFPWDKLKREDQIRWETVAHAVCKSQLAVEYETIRKLKARIDELEKPKKKGRKRTCVARKV